MPAGKKPKGKKNGKKGREKKAAPKIVKTKGFSDLHALVATLLPLVKDPLYIEYGDQEKMQGSIKQKKLAKEKKAIGILHSLSPSFNFVKSILVKAHKRIAEQKVENKEWYMSKNDIDEFASEVSERIKILCRHCTRTITTTWFRNMMKDRNTGRDKYRNK